MKFSLNGEQLPLRVRLWSEELSEFKYLGHTMLTDGGLEAELKQAWGGSEREL